MGTRKSNNRTSVIHRLITDEYGENYWFNGSAKYVMECLGEKDFDYLFFAGLTGDVFAQQYKPFFPDGVFVGYEEYGETLLYITGNNKKQKEAARIYREVSSSLPTILTTDNDKYCFGAPAFRKWAADIEGGIF